MAVIPYMRLYIADYKADTEHLTTVQHGAYMLLIMAYWQTGKPLPDDDKKLARIAKLPLREWKRHRETLIEFFDCESMNGFICHDRIDEELALVVDKSLKAQRAGRASVQRRLNGRSTDAEQTSNHTDSDTDTPSSTKDVEEGRASARPSDGKKAAKPKPQIEIAGEETIMRAVREDLRNRIPAGQYALFADPVRPIIFIAEEGRLVACCPDAVAHMTVRDLEYRLSQVAQEHGFSAAWIRERPI